ncbi:FecR domain-containing protein [Candidatus Peribacteria bacterium]|jgi:hypothetical protein|nr:FecR domain-containing protein [Candidatus Peribacteria bacterium]MBT4021277.1 FecR domain-containing protein [Candidatus Peribacteria bacterium]MBT4240350.1 FecR domain-containing protein [Candidatus Peribacteria bacterium]MBT4474053.1 FecR domain-containing protein [Candidatus Peribacteria bacterium]
MKLERTIKRLVEAKKLTNRAKMRKNILKRIEGRMVKDITVKSFNPSSDLRSEVLNRISQNKTNEALSSTRNFLSPGSNVIDILKREIIHRISGAPRGLEIQESFAMLFKPRLVRFASATVIFALLLRITPALFIATPTLAESQSLLIPTKGFVATIDGAEWSPVSEQIDLSKAVTIRTGADSEATVVLRDNAILRIAENTEINLRETAFDISANRSIARVIYGQIWVSSFLSDALSRESKITIPQGTVTIKQGSVNILADPQQSTVQVFHRSANVFATGAAGNTYLVQGDQLSLLPESQTQRHIVTSAIKNESWTKENLSRDAVHRTEIAERKQLHAESLAGILPTSAFYSVKRASEAIDLLLTIGEKPKQEKKLRNAKTRLNEAVALLKTGEKEAAQMQLDEYKSEMQEIAENTDADTRDLLTDSLIDSNSTVSSALPHSELYVAKKAVLETSAELSTSELSMDQIDLYLLSDALLNIESLISEGQIENAYDAFNGISIAISSVLENNELNEVAVEKNSIKSIKNILRSVAFSLEQSKEVVEAQQIKTASKMLAEVNRFLPITQIASVPAEAQKQCMNAREIVRRTNQFLSSVYTYKTSRAQRNEVLRQIAELPDCIESGKILSKVMNKVPVFTRSFVWEAIQEMESDS